jgi:hypothetical protein
MAAGLEQALPHKMNFGPRVPYPYPAEPRVSLVSSVAGGSLGDRDSGHTAQAIRG